MAELDASKEERKWLKKPRFKYNELNMEPPCYIIAVTMHFYVILFYVKLCYVTLFVVYFFS